MESAIMLKYMFMYYSSIATQIIHKNTRNIATNLTVAFSVLCFVHVRKSFKPQKYMPNSSVTSLLQVNNAC